MSEEQMAGIRRRRTRAEAEQLVREYEASGLSRQEFCRKNGLALATLDRYRRRHVPGEPAADGRWVAVEVSGSGAGHELAVLLSGGRRIEVRRGFDGHTLGQLVRVLEQV